jgi:hypothetical protein
VEKAQGAAGCVERMHRPRGVVVEEAGVSPPGGLKETDATPVWQR